MKPVWIFASAVILFSMAAQAADTGKTAAPLNAMTYIEVAPDAAGTALNALRDYRRDSLREGAKAADIFQESGQSNRFVVNEIWSDAEALAGHEKSSSFAALSGKLKPVSFKPIDVRAHTHYRG